MNSNSIEPNEKTDDHQEQERPRLTMRQILMNACPACAAKFKPESQDTCTAEPEPACS